MKTWNYILMFLLFCSVIQIQATDYYVNANHENADDNNAGTSADAPWKTLNLGKLLDGSTDVVHVAPGNYYITDFYLIRGNVTIEGSSKDEVFIQGMTDAEFVAGDNHQTGKFFDTWGNLNFTVRNVTVKNMRNTTTENNNLPDRGIFNTEANTKLTLENVDIKNSIAERNTVMRAWGPVIMKNVLVENCSLDTPNDERNFAIVGVNSVAGQKTQLSMERVCIRDCNSAQGSIVTVAQPEGDAACESECNIDNCIFEDNTYANWGSCLRVVCVKPGKATFQVNSSFFQGNQGGNNGVVFIEADKELPDNSCTVELLLKNNIFVENYASDPNGTSVFGISGRSNLWTTGVFSFVNNTMLSNGKGEVGKDAWALSYAQRPNATFNFINNIALNENNKTLVFGNANENTGVGDIKGNLTCGIGGGASNFMVKFDDRSLGNENIDMGQLRFGELVRPMDGNVPYIPTLEGSYNIDKGVNHELVPDLDICGTAVYGGKKDVGAYEYIPTPTTNLILSEGKNLFVYPNPFADVINLSESAEKVELFNTNGTCLQSCVNTSRIYTAGLDEGIYLIRVTTEAGTVSTFKMIK